MIRYALHCDSGHAFEAWFRGSGDCDAQVAAGQVSCPNCGSTKVSKALMTPAVGRRGAEAPPPLAAPSSPAPVSAQAHTLAADAKAKALVEAIRRLRRHVTEHADYVGDRFPEEARRIHHEEAEHRSIYGEASPEEAKALIEEGIEIQPLPRLPDEQN